LVIRAGRAVWSGSLQERLERVETSKASGIWLKKGDNRKKREGYSQESEVDTVYLARSLLDQGMACERVRVKDGREEERAVKGTKEDTRLTSRGVYEGYERCMYKRESIVYLSWSTFSSLSFVPQNPIQDPHQFRTYVIPYQPEAELIKVPLKYATQRSYSQRDQFELFVLDHYSYTFNDKDNKIC
jgi:hypothetical protein